MGGANKELTASLCYVSIDLEISMSLYLLPIVCDAGDMSC